MANTSTKRHGPAHSSPPEDIASPSKQKSHSSGLSAFLTPSRAALSPGTDPPPIRLKANSSPRTSHVLGGLQDHTSPRPHQSRHLKSRRGSFVRSPTLCFLIGAFVSQSLVFLIPFSLKLALPHYPAFSGLFQKGLESMTGIRPRFVLFGDSLTQHSFGEGGWGAALQDQYARKVDVVLRGYSGYNTRWARFLLPKIFPSEEPSSGQGPVALATVFFGANDAVLPDRASKKQFVPLEEYQANLEGIVQAIQKSAPTAKVILISPPPVDEGGRLRHARELYKENAVTEPERTNENTGKYAAACKAAASRLGVPVVDLWSRLQLRHNWPSLLSDGLHFTPAGNSAVFEEVLSVLNFSFPEFKWDVLPWDFPEHSAIDGDRPALAFRNI